MNKKSIVKNTFIFLSCSIILLSFSYHPKDNDLVATKASMPSATKDARELFTLFLQMAIGLSM